MVKLQSRKTKQRIMRNRKKAKSIRISEDLAQGIRNMQEKLGKIRIRLGSKKYGLWMGESNLKPEAGDLVKFINMKN